MEITGQCRFAAAYLKHTAVNALRGYFAQHAQVWVFESEDVPQQSRQDVVFLGVNA